MSDNSVKNILICGSGLAGWMTAAALTSALPDSFKVTVLDTSESNQTDILYGTVTAPEAYTFFLNIGFSEPDLLQNTNTSFCFGTRYSNWSPDARTWIQCYHQPFPIWDNIPFIDHVLSRKSAKLEDFLVSAKAGERGVFAHPPENAQHPLSRAEYGYLINPVELSECLKSFTIGQGADVMTGDIKDIETYAERVRSIRISDHKVIQADLFIDCTGPEAKLLSHLGADFKSIQTAFFASNQTASPTLGAPLREVKASPTGWVSETILRGRTLTFEWHRQDIDGSDIENSHSVKLGIREQAWLGNCVGIGHSAAMIEPITPAPMMVLHRDIERLLELIPVTTDMTVEAREYNRSFHTDYEHAVLFNDAFYYSQKTSPDSINPKLMRKITQFENRGNLVAYDNELFNAEDWSILHFGMGRRVKHPNFFAGLADTKQIDARLNELKRAVEITTQKMPPHHIYMTKLLSYLERKHVGRS